MDTCPTAVHIRDSEIPEGPTLTLAPSAWSSFATYAADGARLRSAACCGPRQSRSAPGALVASGVGPPFPECGVGGPAVKGAPASRRLRRLRFALTLDRRTSDALLQG
ncbi:DUF397 domain-containing protein, partial [Streptomyces chryseus]